MYEACEPDLRKWPIEEFKCASNDSSIVHPPGRTLTPHSTAVAAATAKATLKAKALRKRRR